MTAKFQGLVAATLTPFHADGSLNPAMIERQAGALVGQGISAVFIGGTTGECHSLSLAERLSLTQRWSEVARGTSLRLVVHVGSNCLSDSRALAAQAQDLDVAAIAAFAPSYFKPASVESLVACCADIAGAAPKLPFYFYDIPRMTGVSLPMSEFLSLGSERIPPLAGLKFTNSDLMSFQQCLHLGEGKFDILWGFDEYLLAAVALGAHGAVGSTYNFAAPMYLRMLAAFQQGDLQAARKDQYRSVQLIALLNQFGFLAGARAILALLGVDLGPVRLPNANLTSDQKSAFLAALEKLGFWDWIRP